MSKWFSNLWLLGKADVVVVDVERGEFVTGDSALKR